jgi:dTDP-4-dehydrorhamnose reductase
MNNILVTGANGQLGMKIRDCAKDFPKFNFLFTDIQELDITNKIELESFVVDNKIDLIINCAAYTAVDNAENDLDNAYKLNSFAPESLAEISTRHNLKFIHISTDYVFDGTANLPYNEVSQTNPASVYGKSKLDGEKRALNSNTDCVIIRTSWLYSEYGNNFAKTILRLAKEKEMLKVVYDQVGTPTYAGNLAESVLLIVNGFFSKDIWNPGIYHYSNLGVCSWYDFAIKLVKSKNIEIEIIPVLSHEFVTKAKRPAYSVFDKSKIIKTFGIKIPYWTDACDEMLKNYIY